MKQEERLRSMMKTIGLDPKTVDPDDMPVIAAELQERCRSCGSEEACEEWLQGVKKGDPGFCPNSPLFEILRKYGGHSA